MSAAFTPGPWTYSTHSDGWSYTINIAQADDAAYTPDWSDVAFATCRGERQQIQEANARLIAAAPEMLEALILMVRTHDEPAESLLQEMKEQQWLAQARAAIAKALGEAA
jgi:hypothetical protein